MAYAVIVDVGKCGCLIDLGGIILNWSEAELKKAGSLSSPGALPFFPHWSNNFSNDIKSIADKKRQDKIIGSLLILKPEIRETKFIEWVSEFQYAEKI